MKKILVVDNDTDILYVVEHILQRHNYIVKTISEWATILVTIKSFVPDLILLDIDLNGADGGDICQDLKQSKETQQIPIILFSGYNLSKKYVMQSNAQGFLIKPFEPSNLVKIISDNIK